MRNLFLFYWSRNLGVTYGNGAEIEFFNDNNSVHYENRILMPGRAIYSWAVKGKDEINAPQMQLPFLDPEKTYAFSVNGTIIPRDSIGVEVEFYDSDRQFIERKVTEGREDTLEFPPGATDYGINLVSFGNLSLFFRNLVLGDRQTMEDFQVILDDNLPILLVIPRQRPEDSSLEVRLVKTQMPVQQLQFKQSRTTIFVQPPKNLADSGRELSRFTTKIVSYLLVKFDRKRLSALRITPERTDFESLADLIRERVDSAFSTYVDDFY